MSKKTDNPGYVSKTEFNLVTGHYKKEIVLIKRALFGEDMRSGLVGDVQTIKANTSGAMAIIKNVVLPITTSFIAVLLTAYFLGAIP